MKRSLALFEGLAALVALVFVLVPPVYQSQAYHAFADQRTLLGIPNFWNVVTNLPFVAVALWGLRAYRSKTAFQRRWERHAYAVVLAGSALVAAGSGWYHWNPNDATLVWDRLPMTLLFTAVSAMIAGDRVGLGFGQGLLWPLVLTGAASIVVWQRTGDLRLYGTVQFLPMVAVPLLLLIRAPRYSGSMWLWLMCAFYGIAKLLELGDAEIGRRLSTGGHPWKHMAAAAALGSFCAWVAGRRPMRFD